MVAFGQLMRRLTFSGADQPDRCIVAFLFLVSRHPDEGNARPVRRNLMITDPDKIEQILFGYVSLLSKRDASSQRENEQEANDEARMSNNEGMTMHRS